MLIQIIKLKSSLPEEELVEVAHDRKPRFEALPGRLQKYDVKTQLPGHYAGIDIRDSAESLEAFRATDLAKSIPEAYHIESAPDIGIMDVFFKPRE